MDRESFKNPGKEYRPSPFWSWNNRLDPEELRWQVREFAEKGFGGYFMHARMGLVTPYLSREWMNCIRTCLDEGRKVGLESWLYDEDKWPSGFAGGFVPAGGDQYRARFVRLETIKIDDVAEALKDNSVIGVFEIHFASKDVMKEFKRVSKVEEIIGSGQILSFRVQLANQSSWFGGESYVDLLNPEVTRKFLSLTHDAYAREFKRDFGEHMPGIFTDEPNYFMPNFLNPEMFIPWTDGLPEYFKKLNGYDILDKLPLLYFEGQDFHKVRYDFWRTTTSRFVESFTKPYSDKCQELGLKMTGHYLAEEELGAQAMIVGAAMPHYEYMQCPGIDHLGCNLDFPITMKQCASVAHQFGKKRILSELFGASGQGMTFEDQKWVADFHFVLGITFLVPHLTLYTMKGITKRDFPPTFSYHQPYWPHFKIVNDYFSRACYLCSQGEFYADILLLQPMGSVWATINPHVSMSEPMKARALSVAFMKLLEDLLALHRDFDLGDETIMARHAQIQEKEIVIKNGRYKVAMVPPSLTWARKTFNLMKELLEAGGKIMFIGEIPRLIDGEPAEAEWREILNDPNSLRVAAETGAIEEAINITLPRSISVTEEGGKEIEDIYVHHRVESPYHIYFLSNKSRTKTYNATVKFSEKGEVTEWNLFDGSVSELDAEAVQGKTIVTAVFPPTGSRAFVIDPSRTKKPSKFLHPTELVETSTRKVSEWKFERLHPNSMVLDFFQYHLGDGKWSEKMPLWKIRFAVLRSAGFENPIDYLMMQPWVLASKDIKPSKSFTLHLRGTFTSEVKGKHVSLVMEKASMWKLIVNGEPVSTATIKWHWDKSFGKIDLSDYIEIGENHIDLSCAYQYGIPVEDVYLIGDFGVKKALNNGYMLSDEPRDLASGDWTKQGYPFYTGSMRYKTVLDIKKKPGEKTFVNMSGAKGSLFLVSVNGKKPVPIFCHPLEVDITEFVHDGANELAIDVVSTLRNTFGPLHNKLENPPMVDPLSFTDEKNWADDYQLVPYGLLAGAEIVTKKTRGKE